MGRRDDRFHCIFKTKEGTRETAEGKERKSAEHQHGNTQVAFYCHMAHNTSFPSTYRLLDSHIYLYVNNLL